MSFDKEQGKKNLLEEVAKNNNEFLLDGQLIKVQNYEKKIHERVPSIKILEIEKETFEQENWTA